MVQSQISRAICSSHFVGVIGGYFYVSLRHWFVLRSRTPPIWCFYWPAGTVITYNALLSACEKAGQWQQALHLGVFLAISIYRYLQIFWSLASSNHGKNEHPSYSSSIHRDLMGIVAMFDYQRVAGPFPGLLEAPSRRMSRMTGGWKNRCPSNSRLQDDLWISIWYTHVVYPWRPPIDQCWKSSSNPLFESFLGGILYLKSHTHTQHHVDAYPRVN